MYVFFTNSKDTSFINWVEKSSFKSKENCLCPLFMLGLVLIDNTLVAAFYKNLNFIKKKKNHRKAQFLASLYLKVFGGNQMGHRVN